MRFHEASVEATTPTRTNAQGLAFQGKWCFTLTLRGTRRGARAIRDARKAYLDEVEFRRYKIGIKIKATQVVTELAFRGTAGWFQMVPDGPTTTELTQTFGADAEDQWVGFVPPASVRRRAAWRDGLTVCYGYRLEVTPVTREPQAAVCVITYGDLAFAAHHLKSALLLSEREKSTRTATRALVP